MLPSQAEAEMNYYPSEEIFGLLGGQRYAVLAAEHNMCFVIIPLCQPRLCPNILNTMTVLSIFGYVHVLLCLFSFIFHLTEIPAIIAAAMANLVILLLCGSCNQPTSFWNENLTPYDAMFLVPVSCVSGMHNLDTSFWYEIVVPVLGRRTWVVCHRPKYKVNKTQRPMTEVHVSHVIPSFWYRIEQDPI